MRLLAIGDIHGCFTALSALWEIVQPSDADVMVFLGDYVDRGPQSREVLDWLLNESAKSQRIFLRGNHEVMMLDARDNPIHADSWKSCGGLETLMSYGIARSFGWPSEIPDAHWEFLRKTARHHETAKHIFVHGCLDPRLDPDEQLDDVIYWETFDQLKPHKSRKKIVCGHTPI